MLGFRNGKKERLTLACVKTNTNANLLACVFLPVAHLQTECFWKTWKSSLFRRSAHLASIVYVQLAPDYRSMLAHVYIDVRLKVRTAPLEAGSCIAG